MGYLAIFFTTVSFLPQAIKTLKTRRVEDLSLITYLFLFLGSLSWFLYGNYLNDIPLMATNSMTTIDRKSTRLNSSHSQQSRMPSSA